MTAAEMSNGMGRLKAQFLDDTSHDEDDVGWARRDLSKILQHFRRGVALDLPALDCLINIQTNGSSGLNRYRALLRAIPVDSRSFGNVLLGLEQEQVVDDLTAFCKSFRKLDCDTQWQFESTFAFAAVVLLTIVALQESELRRLPQVHPKAVIPTSSHECDELCQPLLRDQSVRTLIWLLYDLTMPGTNRGAALTRTGASKPPTPAGSSATAKVSEAAVEPGLMILDSLKFYRHGTTSLILQVEREGEYPTNALKLLLFPFHQIPSISQATERYARDYSLRNQDPQHLVRVSASTKRWILMDLKEGDSLSEHIQRQSSGPTAHGHVPRSSDDTTDTASDSRLNLPSMRVMGAALFNALEEMQKCFRRGHAPHATFVHGDLTPSNMIVDAEAESFDLILIDLGRNYLYTQSLTGLEGPEAVFIAPEVKAGYENISRADLFSVGQLLITFAGHTPNVDGLVPDEFYEQVPLLARFLEDFTAGPPGDRMLVIGPDNPIDYARLRGLFLDEVDAASQTQVLGSRPANRLASLVRELVTPLSGEPQRQRRLWKVISLQKTYNQPHRRRYLRWLYVWSWLAASMSTLTAVSVVWWLARDAGWDWGNRPIEALQRLAGTAHDEFPYLDSLWAPGYTVPNLTDNWKARVVGLSYALMAMKLYQNVYARMAPIASGWYVPGLRFQSIAAEAWMRLMPVVNTILVLWVTFIEARFWPIAAAIGQTFALLGNYFTESFARRSLQLASAAELATVPNDSARVTGLDAWAEWAKSSAFYSVVVWAIGLLIYTQHLEDEWLYALGVAAINIGLFYIIKCGLGGGKMRIAMHRAIFAAGRLAARGRPRTR
jgi:serine/threonine protein kinase